MPQLGPGSPIFFMGFSRQMKKTILIHSMIGCGFLYIVYRLGFFHPLRRLLSSTPNRWDILQSFPEANGDAMAVTWYHRANSRRDLKEAVRGSYMMIESDILIGTTGIPIMAHPPLTSSDLTFEVWLNTLKQVPKGLKLDFKGLESVPKCLKLLAEADPELLGPVIINGDIAKGPYGKHSGLHAEKFVKLFQKYYPQGLLSIGWTTDEGDSGYSWRHVFEMFTIIKKHGLLGDKKQEAAKITFPVRASLMHPNAVKKLLWLLEMVPDSSLTVFGVSGDKRKTVDDLLLMRLLFPKQSLFFDIAYAYPESALQTVQAGLQNEARLLTKFADFMVDLSNLKTAWDILGSPEGQHFLTSYSLMSGGQGAALVSQRERRSTYLEQTNFRTFFYPFATSPRAMGACNLEIVLRHAVQLTNELTTPPGLVCRLELPSGRMAIQAIGDRDAAMVEERLQINDAKTANLAYRLSVQDDGQRVAFVVTVLERYDEPEMLMRTSKRLVLASKLNSDIFFRPAVIARCVDPDTMFVLHDVKV